MTDLQQPRRKRPIAFGLQQCLADQITLQLLRRLLEDGMVRHAADILEAFEPHLMVNNGTVPARIALENTRSEV